MAEKTPEPMTPDELWALVLSICDGHTITSDRIPKESLGMVFMPLMLGAFTPPEMPEDSIEPPKPPDAYETPLYPTPPAEPQRSQQDIDTDAKRRALGEDLFRAAWDLDKEEVAELQAQIAALPAVADYEAQHQLNIMAWEAAMEAQAGKNAVKKAAHDAAMQAYKAELVLYEAGQEGREERYKARTKAYVDSLDIGFIYESLDKQLPRSCNGNPCFASFHICPTQTAAKVNLAVQAEMKRRDAANPFKDKDI